MKISIVEPKSPFYNFYTMFIERLPLLGPIYLGTILKERGHDVTVYNENIKELDLSQVADSDVLGISIMTTTAPRGYEIAERYRELNPRGRVIIGGAHATFLPEEAAQYADHVVTGEGEVVISDLVESGGEHIVRGIPVEDLDGLPFPDFSLVHGLKDRMSITPISTSRGCPYDCTFCSVSPMFGRRYRFRSAQSVLAELSRSRHKSVFFYDDNFAANRTRTRELLTGMTEERTVPRWTAQVRADVARDEELVALMAEAKCRHLCIGFESVDAETLKQYNKKQAPEDIVRCIDVLHRHGIRVHGMFISEGYSDVYDKLGIDSLQLSILIPIIGSRLYDGVRDAGRFIVKRFPTDWQLFDGSHVVHLPDKISPLEMQRQTLEAMKKFYSRYNAARMFFKGRFADFYIRSVGRRLIRKWEIQNKDYLARLKQSYGLSPSPSEPGKVR
ncbi:MAG: radical SAM protein [Chloroflexota bacterium]|nr:radical SAM protein [Chloroflexota bacterium]